MAVRYQTKGFLIKKEARGEADWILDFYTEDFGRIKVLGRAIRKINSKLKGGIKLFSLSKIEFIQGKKYKTLTNAVIEKNFNSKSVFYSSADGLKYSFEKLKTAFHIFEIAEELIKDEEKDKLIWELFNEVFEKLNDCSSLSAHCSLIYYYFFWNLVSVLGYKINLYNCAFCQKKLPPRELYFSFKKKGIVCFDCFKKNKKGVRISPEVVKLLRLFLKKDWKTILRIKKIDNYKDSLKLISDSYLKVLNI